MSYHAYGSLGASLPPGARLTEDTRRQLLAKLDMALARYRALSVEIRALVRGVPFTASKYAQAKAIALRAGSGSTVQLTRDQLAALIVGTFLKIENVLVRARAVTAVAYETNVAGLVNNAITVADRAMLRMSQLRNAVRLLSGATSGLGQSSQEIAAGTAVAIGLLLAPVTFGASLLLVGGGVAYLLAQSGTELDVQAEQISQVAQGMRDYCAGRGDTEACMTEFQRAEQIATESRAQLAIAQAEADAIRRRAEAEGIWGRFLGPAGTAFGIVIVGGAVAVGAYMLYLTWPLLTGARRVSQRIAGNRRRRRRIR